jgi:hypothetical protein
MPGSNNEFLAIIQILLPCCNTQRPPEYATYIHPLAISKKRIKT